MFFWERFPIIQKTVLGTKIKLPVQNSNPTLLGNILRTNKFYLGIHPTPKSNHHTNLLTLHNLKLLYQSDDFKCQYPMWFESLTKSVHTSSLSKIKLFPYSHISVSLGLTPSQLHHSFHPALARLQLDWKNTKLIYVFSPAAGMKYCIRGALCVKTHR